MTFKNIFFLISFCVSATFLLSSCNGEGNASSFQRDTHTVWVHQLSDPDGLNPYISQGASAGYIQGQIFTGLLSIDGQTQEIVPVVAKARPTIEKIDEGMYAGGLKITFEIREEAMWDNGKPITAHDVEFTLKCIKNPQCDTERSRPYYEFLDSMWINPDNPKNFAFYTKDRYIRSETSSGLYLILPRYIYDSEGIMDKFSLFELNQSENQERLKADPDIIKFGKHFNSEKFMREKEFVVGGGAYLLGDWITGQRVEVVKKENWWGDELAKTNKDFLAVPPKIVYEVYNDQTTMLVAMKGEKLDVSTAAKPKDFVELKDEESFTSKFSLHSPDAFSYYYVGLNMDHPILGDLLVRQAMAHLFNTDQIIDNVFYGLASKCIGPVHPSRPYYNSGISPYPYDLEIAKSLLEKAGWSDSDGDGILDKEIEGELTKFSLQYIYNQGNQQRETIGLLLQEVGRKVGMEIGVQSKEWSVFLQTTKDHDFDLYCGAWIGVPLLDDFKQIWHTESIDGGSNYVSFGDEYSDQIIDSIRFELNEEYRNSLYQEFQQVLHDQVPYVFLFSLKERIIVHNRFTNIGISEVRPGYSTSSFTVRSDYLAN